MTKPGSLALQAYAVAEIAPLLERLEDELRRAAGHGAPETVHDVRVAIRRSTQALRVFSTLLPAKPVKKIRQRLRRALDAAAAVRDLDIALALLSEAGLAPAHSLWEETRAQRYAAELAFCAELELVVRTELTVRWRDKLGLVQKAAP